MCRVTRASTRTLIPIMEDVISRYMKDVVNRAYPAEKETVFMSPEECLAFANGYEVGAQDRRVAIREEEDCLIARQGYRELKTGLIGGMSVNVHQ